MKVTLDESTLPGVSITETHPFEEIMDVSKPEVKTLDPHLMKIGDQLQIETSADVPQGVPLIPEELKQSAELSAQLPWIIFSLILTFLIPFFFSKRGK